MISTATVRHVALKLVVRSQSAERLLEYIFEFLMDILQTEESYRILFEF